MRRKQLLGYSLAGVIAVVLGHGIAVAQAPDAPTPPEPAKQVTLTPQEMQQQVSQWKTQLEGTRASIADQLQDARKQNDVVKTLCLDDKLNQTDKAIEKLNERVEKLDRAVAASPPDESGAQHEFTIASFLGKRGQELAAEAAQCVGKEVRFVGDSSTKASYEGDPLADDGGYVDETYDIFLNPGLSATGIR